MPTVRPSFPVGGVSWYEAAAYAAFAGKSLPTIHHWYRAAGLGRFADILTVSNFDGKGPAPVGSHAGLGPFGTYDMAGNVKEWCSTETNHRRFLLGGAWNEPRDMFADYDAKEPFERAPGYGFRLAKYIRPLPPAVAAPVPIEALGRTPESRNRSATTSSRCIEGSTPTTARRSTPSSRRPKRRRSGVKHTVAFDAAYGGERMRAHLFLPRNGSPPYQTVVFFPAADAFRPAIEPRHVASSGWTSSSGAGERSSTRCTRGPTSGDVRDEMGPFAERELRIAWSRDLGRAIDYLETRSDIDRDSSCLLRRERRALMPA